MEKPNPDWNDPAVYDWPFDESLIAQTGAEPRDASRLYLPGDDDATDRHLATRNLPDVLVPGDLLVFNDTKVRSGRLRARRATGAKVELLVVDVDPSGLLDAMVRPAGRLKTGEVLVLTADEALTARLDARTEWGWIFRLSRAGRDLDARETEEAIDRAGETPLPPYITTGMADPGRYQTLFADRVGSAAAPTAGLHFTPALLARLAARGVESARLTLHVGPGTFQPVKAERLDGHRMHVERYEIGEDATRALSSARQEGRRIVAVGTTTLRTLESVWRRNGAFVAETGATDIFIHPPQTVGSADLLLTNFHLPRSTLLMLACAFAGFENMKRIYARAQVLGYRFYSLGDAMLLENRRREEEAGT